MKDELKIAVFISGAGSTLRNLMERRASGQLSARIEAVICSHPGVAGIAIAEQAGLPVDVLDYRQYSTPPRFSAAAFNRCREAGAELVALGGFIRKLQIPADFAGRVINIHPSLIPAFCGQGFYGRRVHAAAIDFGCRVSGCTVHIVDDQYDHGPILAQRAVPIEDGDTPETLAARVGRAESELYPEVINRWARGAPIIAGRRANWPVAGRE